MNKSVVMRMWVYDIAAKFQIVRWAQEERATAFTETVILFPVLISILMACFDLGQGILVNQKTIGASQIIGDLITRDRTVTATGLQDIIIAGQLALEPYSTEPFGYDIVSIEFDEDGEPEILWRVTFNADENDDAVTSTEGLGAPGEGVVVVTASYRYDPYFTNFIVDEINMREVAFLRGRKSPTVMCDDCPSL